MNPEYRLTEEQKRFYSENGYPPGIAADLYKRRDTQACC